MMRGPNEDGEPSVLVIGYVHPAEVSGGVADHKNKRTPFALRRDVEARGFTTHEHESETRDLPFLAISRLSDPIIFVKPWLGVKAELCNFLPSFYLHCIVNDGPQLRNAAHQVTLPRTSTSIWKFSSYSLVGREKTWGMS